MERSTVKGLHASQTAKVRARVQQAALDYFVGLPHGIDGRTHSWVCRPTMNVGWEAVTVAGARSKHRFWNGRGRVVSRPKLTSPEQSWHVSRHGLECSKYLWRGRVGQNPLDLGVICLENGTFDGTPFLQRSVSPMRVGTQRNLPKSMQPIAGSKSRNSQRSRSPNARSEFRLYQFDRASKLDLGGRENQSDSLRRCGGTCACWGLGEDAFGIHRCELTRIRSRICNRRPRIALAPLSLSLLGESTVMGEFAF